MYNKTERIHAVIPVTIFWVLALSISNDMI